MNNPSEPRIVTLPLLQVASVSKALNLAAKDSPAGGNFATTMGRYGYAIPTPKTETVPELSGAEWQPPKQRAVAATKVLPKIPDPSVFQKPPSPTLPIHPQVGVQALAPAGPQLSMEERTRHLVNLPPPREDLRSASIPEPPNQQVLLAEHFEKRASTIFFKRQLVVGEQKCQIVDIEMFRSPDPFTPQDPRFLTKDNFAFHRKYTGVYGAEGGTGDWEYSTGRRKGLYLTFGMEGVLEGVLLRAILTPTGFVEGPGQVVDYIMAALGFETLDALVNDLQKNSGTTDGSIPVKREGRKLNLRKFKNASRKILVGPRLSIRLPKDATPYDMTCQFLARPFRFVSRGDLIKQGRHFIAMYMRLKGCPDQEIIQELKLPVDVLLTWASHFSKGQLRGVDSFMGEDRPLKASIKDDLLRYGCFQQLEF